jgi:serine/threonine protein kinase
MSSSNATDYTSRVTNNLRLNKRFNDRHQIRYSPYMISESPIKQSKSTAAAAKKKKTAANRDPTMSPASAAAAAQPVVLLRQEQSLRSNIGGQERNVKVFLLSSGLSNLEHLTLQRSFATFTETIATTIGSRTDEAEWGAPKLTHTFSPARSSPTWSAHFQNMHLDACEQREKLLANEANSGAGDALAVSTPIPFEDFLYSLGGPVLPAAVAAAAAIPLDQRDTPNFSTTTTTPAVRVAESGDSVVMPPESSSSATKVMVVEKNVLAVANDDEAVNDETIMNSQLVYSSSSSVSSSLMSTSPPLTASPPKPALNGASSQQQQQQQQRNCLEERVHQFRRLVARCNQGPASRSLAEQLKDLPARDIGKGTYGRVFSLRIDSQLTAAFKRIEHKHYESHEESTNEVQSEAQIALELTRSMLLNARVSCPHFLAVAAYDVTLAPLRVSRDYSVRHASTGLVDVDALRSRLHGTPGDANKEVLVASQLVSEFCEGGTLHNYLNRLIAEGDATLDQGDAVQAAEFVGALVAQLLIGVLVAASCQVSHNDLTLANVFLRLKSTEEHRCLRYEFARDEVGFGVGAVLEVPTGAHVPLLVIGDFGLASVHNWHADWRVADVYGTKHRPKERDRLQRTLPLYYYAANKAHTINFKPLPNLLLTAHGDADGHFKPLLFAGLEAELRDMATVLSCLHEMGKFGANQPPLAHLPPQPHRWSALLMRVTGDALALLSKTRPKNYVELKRFVMTFFGSEPIYANWWTRASGAVDIVTKGGGGGGDPINTCRIPTAAAGARINATLLRTLRRLPENETRHVISSQADERQ